MNRPLLALTGLVMMAFGDACTAQSRSPAPDDAAERTPQAACEAGAGTVCMPPFWAQNGGRSQRVVDRLLVGGATANDGALPNRRQDWLARLQTNWGHAIGYTVPAQLAALTTDDPSSSYAVLGGAQTARFDHAGAAAIAVQGHAIANNAQVRNTHAWAFYGEAHRTAATSGNAYGIELDPVGHAPSVTPSTVQQGNLVGIQDACGGEYEAFVAHDCSAAMQVVANGARFLSGIIVMQGAIASQRPALQLPAGNGIAFEDATGTTVATITGTSSGASGLAIVAAPKKVISMGTMQLAPVGFAELPECDAGHAGTLAYVIDADVPITAWRQPVNRGGGHNHALVSCNGADWQALSD